MNSFSNLEKLISAFEIMSQPLEDVQFSDDFFYYLTKELSIPKSPQKFLKGSEYSNSIISIKNIRDLCKKMRKRTKLSENEETLVNNLTLFLKHFQFSKSLKKYFDEKVYSSIYLAYFNPIEFVIPAQSDLSNSNNIFLTEITPSMNFKELIKYDNKMRMNEIIENLWNLNLRWNKLLDEENTQVNYMENETQLQQKHGEEQLNICKYVFFDLNLKTKKSVSMLRKWIKDTGKSFKGNLSGRNEIGTVREIERSVEKLDEEIKTLENIINHVKIDNQMLINKENALIKTLTKNEDIVKLRDSVNNDYESLLAKRKELIANLNYSINGTLKYNKISKDICQIEGIINNVFSDLKSLNYSVYMINEDSSVISSSLKDFVRWSDSYNQFLDDKEKELNEKTKEKERYECILKDIYKNIQRLKSVVGSKIGEWSAYIEESSAGSYKALSSKTYSIAEANIRFKDMNIIKFK